MYQFFTTLFKCNQKETIELSPIIIPSFKKTKMCNLKKDQEFYLIKDTNPYQWLKFSQKPTTYNQPFKVVSNQSKSGPTGKNGGLLNFSNGNELFSLCYTKNTPILIKIKQS